MKRLLLFAALAAALPLAAAEPGLRPMTTAEIAAFGFAPDAATYLTADAASMTPNADTITPLGGSRTTTWSGRELRPNSAGAKLNGTAIPGGALCTANSTDANGELQVRLPQGATLEFLRIWGDDASNEELAVSLLRRCQPSFDPGTPTIANLAALSSSGTPGDFTLATSIPNAVAIDNETCTYVVRVRFGDGNTSCPGPLSLYKVRIQWSE
jgi:hypothetical protein